MAEHKETYYAAEDLAKFEQVGRSAPEAWKAFMKYYGPLMQDGHLSKREKALIALAVSHGEKCPYCIDSYTRAGLELGLSPDEMAEAVHVAAAMRAGITLAQGIVMNNTLDKLSF